MLPIQIKSNQIFICSNGSNERNEKIDNNSDNEQDSKAQEALIAALVNNSKIRRSLSKSQGAVI